MKICSTSCWEKTTVGLLFVTVCAVLVFNGRWKTNMLLENLRPTHSSATCDATTASTATTSPFSSETDPITQQFFSRNPSIWDPVLLPHNGGNCNVSHHNRTAPTIDEMIRFVERRPMRVLKPKAMWRVVPGWPFAHSPSVLPLIPRALWWHYCTSMSIVKTTVTGGAQSTYPEVIDGSAWPPYPAMSMAGYRRLNNAELLVADVIARGIPGDVIETGVWRGGLSALMTAVVAWLDPSRKVFLADSFKGIPNQGPNATHYDATAHELEILNNNSVEEVKTMFQRLGLLSTGIPRFLVGYFNDTLGPAAARGDFDKGFAVVRLDGDTYLSTMQAIEVLYPRLAVGGYVIVDDYMDWPGCREAITEYRERHHITDAIVPVHHEGAELVRGAFWRKSA